MGLHNSDYSPFAEASILPFSLAVDEACSN